MNNGDGWRTRSPSELAAALGSDTERGIDKKRINEKRRRFGENDLWYTGSPFMFLKPESGFSILGYAVMAVAAFSAAAFGKCEDAPFVGIALAVGALLCIALYIIAGVICKSHSRHWIPECTVIRGGNTVKIPGNELVPGDIVILSEGDRVCADLKLISSEELFVKDPPMTKRKGSIAKAAAGNALAVEGQSAPEDFIYAGSEVVSGSGRAIVAAVGADTLTGRRGKIRLTSDKEPAMLASIRKKSVTAGTAAMIFAFAAVAVGVFSPIAAADFIGLFLIFLAFAISAGGELTPAMCCFMYALSLIRSKDNGLLIRDASGADYVMTCDGVAVENAAMMKAGTAKLTTIFASGKTVEPGSSEGDELFSLLLAGTSSGKGKYGSEILRAVNDHLNGRIDPAKFITANETTKPVFEHTVSGATQYSLFISGGDHWFAVTGSIEDVIQHCTKIRIAGEDVPMTRQHLSDILKKASDASKTASILIAVGLRKSPYNSMKRLSVLTSDLSFAGFIAVDTPADPDLAGDLAYLAQAKLPFFFFTDGSGEDVNFARRCGIIRDRGELVSADDPTDAVTKLLAEESRGGAVVAADEDRITAVLRAARAAGKRVLCIGQGETMKGVGFSAVIGEPTAGSGACITAKGRGEAPVVLNVLRSLRGLLGRFGAVRKYLTVSAIVRAVYALTAVFGMPYVYPSAVLFWGLVLDGAVAMIVLAVRKKRKHSGEQ